MNTGYAAFGFLLIVVGAVSGFYPVSILGVLLLIASFVAPSRRVPPRPQPATQERRRTTVPPQPQTHPEATRAEPKPQMQVAAPQPMTQAAISQTMTATPVLFPTSMFPFISPTTAAQQTQSQKPTTEKSEPRDEIVELAAIAILLRLLSRQGT